MSKSVLIWLVASLAVLTVGLPIWSGQDAHDTKLPGPYRFAVTGFGAEPRDAVREEFHQTYPLSPDGRVALKNVNGAARISVWDRNEVKVDAVKTAANKETLAATEIRVDAKPDFIEIRTESRDHERLGSVEYTLTVPRRAKLDSVSLVNGDLDVDGVAGPVRGRTVNGAINCRNLAGDVDLSSVNGRVNSEIDRLEPAASVTLRSVNGEVSAALPAAASSRLTASTVHGSIKSDFGVPATRERVGQRLDTTLGSGGAPVKLSTVNGAIVVRKR